MNKKGFTLIELLAVIIIIGVIATIGITAISGNVESTRKSAFVDLARTYSESARNMRGKDELPHDPKDGEAVIIKVDALTGVNVDKNKYDTGYGQLDLSASYIAIVNDNHNYKYYVTFLDDTNHAIVDVEYSDLDESLVLSSNDSKINTIIKFRGLTNGVKVTINNQKYTVTNVHDTYVVLKK